MVDRSSRPKTSPRRTPPRVERRVLGLRVSRRWGPARIAYRLKMAVSTVHKILRRYGAALPSDRRTLNLEQRGIDARLANDCR